MPNNVSALLDIQVSVYVVKGDQTSINVLQFEAYKTNVGTVDLETFLTTFDTDNRTNLRSIISSNSFVWGYKAGPWPTTTAAPPSYLKGAGGGNWTGTGGAESLPDQCCVLGTFATNKPGRGRYGRVYLPFVPLAMYDGETGFITDTARIDYTTMLDVLRSINVPGTQGTAKYDLAVAHRTAKNMNTVTSITVSRGVATQRRRGYYGKPNRPPY